MVFDCILVRYGEIGLKGLNRGFFEGMLVKNIRWALDRAGIAYSGVDRIQGRFVVGTTDPNALDVLCKVFGIVSYSPACRLGSDIQEIERAVVEQVRGAMPKTFRVYAQRLDKTLSMKSQEVNVVVGARVVADTGVKVDLSNPELDVGIDMTRDRTYMYLQTFKGCGGLPVGSSARVICLLSGGIDSPVASWTMMRRGCSVTLVHFIHGPTDNVPYSIDSIFRILSSYGPGVRLILVPTEELEREIIMNVPAKYRIIMLRRMFLKASARLMAEVRAHAIVTGDSIGQVASQTVENMEATQFGVNALIMRPLAGMDKQEIIDIARRVGTYEASTVEHVDCCSFLVPKHPSTKTSPEEAVKMDELLDDKGIDRILAAKVTLTAKQDN